MCYNQKADYIALLSAVRFPFFPFLLLNVCLTTPPSSFQWSCPLPGFRLTTSDSPLRGASCLQSAVRLLVIIFQSVTLVSALWRCERREDGSLVVWMAEVENKGRGKGVMFGCCQHCVWRLNSWWWWVDETWCHSTLLLSYGKSPESVS